MMTNNAERTTSSAERYILDEVLCGEFYGKIALFKDMNDKSKVFVQYPSDALSVECNETSLLSSREFQDWAFSFMMSDQKKLTNYIKLRELKDKLAEASSIARGDKTIPERQICKRMAYYEGKIYYNLNDEEHRVVEISSEGWRVISVSQAPVLFPSLIHIKSLPEPRQGGDLKDLLRFVNVGERDFPLVVGWLLAASNSSIDCPILHIEAPKGSGKTTATRFLKELLDPDVLGSVAPFSNNRDLCAAATEISIIGLDNISKFTKKESDELCRVCTGIGYFRRALYTNDKLHAVKLHLPLIANGIDFGVLAPDLQDRCYSVKLRPLSGTSRRAKKELLAEFKEMQPFMLGALFDVLSAGLRNSGYNPQVDTRMMDAAQFTMRAVHDERVSLFTEEEFRQVLTEQKERKETNAIIEEPLSCVIQNLAEQQRERAHSPDSTPLTVWNDSSCKLHQEVMKTAKFLGISKTMPKSVASFGRKLKGLAPMLERLGIRIESQHTSSGTRIEITYEPKEEEREEVVSEMVDNTEVIEEALNE